MLWLRLRHPNVHRVVVRLPLPLRRWLFRIRARRSGRVLAGYAAFIAAGIAAGLVLALPVADVHRRCPPRHEGQTFCEIQKGWGASLTKFALSVLIAFLVADLIFVRLPRWRARRGAVATAPKPGPKLSPLHTDVNLHAAVWGRTDHATKRRRRRLRLPFVSRS
jgi:hypothetical protein